MTDPLKPPIVTPLEAAEEAVNEDDNLPEHELRDTPTDDDEDDALEAAADTDW